MHAHLFYSLFGISVRQLRITPSKIIWTHCEQQKSQPLFWRRNYEDDCDCCTSVWIYGIAVGRNLKDHKKRQKRVFALCWTKPQSSRQRAVEGAYLLLFKLWKWALAYFKVQTFWEAHKNLRNLPHALYIYRVSGHNGQVFDGNFLRLRERCVKTEVM